MGLSTPILTPSTTTYFWYSPIPNTGMCNLLGINQSGTFYWDILFTAVPYRIVRDISVRFLRMISMRYHTSIYT